MHYLVLHVSFALQDTHVIEMTQELAKMLGLKIRKAYVRNKVKKKKKKLWGEKKITYQNNLRCVYFLDNHGEKNLIG